MPTIFKLVVDAVVRHWGSLVAKREGGVAAMTTEMRRIRRGGKSRTKMTDESKCRRGINI